MKFTELTIAVALLAANASAYAVPGWAHTYRNLNQSASSCVYGVRNALYQTIGGGISGTVINAGAYLHRGYTPATAAFVYCIPDPSRKICGVHPGATVDIVTFSDHGQQPAIQLRDAINSAIGHPSETCWP